MASEHFPTTSSQIYDEVRQGVACEVYSKHCIFDPNIDINYGPGCHSCVPEGTIVQTSDRELKLLHYQYMGADYVAERYKVLSERLSDSNRRNRWAFHVQRNSHEYVKTLIDGVLDEATDVVGGTLA
jgi:hypothetical protein